MQFCDLFRHERLCGVSGPYVSELDDVELQLFCEI
jgi:hypothetical protein